jgi:hypothetical protein
MMSKTHAHHHETQPPPPKVQGQVLDRSALDHATRLIHRVCCLAGEPELIDEIQTDNGAIRSAIKRHDTATLFDWLMAMLSYQGISDRVAHDYMEQHGRVTWHEIEHALANKPSCPKLQSYWQFHGCGYHKTSGTCAEPDHIAHCPLPTHNLRNGRLNQTAYSLYLFIRDIADNDLVGWIEAQLVSVDSPADSARHARMRSALLDPLRHVYGISDKVLSMALSVLLLAAPRTMKLWAEVGAGRSQSTRWCTTFWFARAFCVGSTLIMFTVPPAISPIVVPTSFKPLPTRSMLASSIRGSRKPFRGSCSTRSGGTVLRTGSTCATATGSTTISAATTYIAKYGPGVIASCCVQMSKLGPLSREWRRSIMSIQRCC